MSAIATKLLDECTRRGIYLRPGKEGKLKVSLPPEKLPAELREELTRHKAEILSHLNSQALRSNYRLQYEQVAQEVRGVCSEVDVHWLIDQFPSLWADIK